MFDKNLEKKEKIEIIKKFQQNISPLKYNYLINYKDWFKFSNKARNKKQEKFFLEKLNSIFKSCDIKNIIIDIGPGDGYKTKLIWNFVDREKIEAQKIVLDFSKKLLENVNLKNTKKIVLDLDFPKDYQKIKSSEKKFIFFLGGTFGNIDYQKFLENIWQVLEKGDTLIIMNDYFQKNKVSQYKKYYNTEENYKFDISLLNFFGFQSTKKDYQIKVEEENKINAYIKSSKDQEILIDKEKIFFAKGEEILLCSSKKFYKKEFKEVIKNSPFELKKSQIFFSKDTSDSLIVLEK